MHCFKQQNQLRPLSNFVLSYKGGPLVYSLVEYSSTIAVFSIEFLMEETDLVVAQN